MIRITGLFIYPVKSLKGIPLNSATTSLRGFEYDREWMITDTGYQFVTQRQIEKMATISVAIDANELTLTCSGYEPLAIDLKAKKEQLITAKVWSDHCAAYDEGDEASIWLTTVLGTYGGKPLRLVRFSQNELRPVPSEFLQNEKAQSAFSDQFPYLITAEETLNYLNENLRINGSSEMTMTRFRANIVVKGLDKIEQKTNDDLEEKDSSYCFGLRKPCKRCKITTIDQNTGEIKEPKEPLATLTKLALSPVFDGAFFGQNSILLGNKSCTIKVGDSLILKGSL